MGRKGHRCKEKAQKASLRRCHLKALERKAVHQVTGGSREPHLQSTVGTVVATCSRELKYSGGLALSAQDVQSRARRDRTQGEQAHLWRFDVAWQGAAGRLRAEQ